MKFWMAVRVFGWMIIAVWVVRLCLGLTSLSWEQIVLMLLGGVVGGVGALFYVRRVPKRDGGRVVR